MITYSFAEKDAGIVSDNRNVIDVYKNIPTDSIKSQLKSKSHPFSVFCTNLEQNLNVSGIIRTANAFAARKVYIYGRKKYDRRGTCGTHNYTEIGHIPLGSDLDNLDLPSGTVWIGVENIETSLDIQTYKWPLNKHICLVFGCEANGIDPSVLTRCRETVYIPMYGSVRSLNVSVAAGIAMNELVSKL